MAYFPESVLISNTKSEAADINGNQYVVSASDHNRIDEEIRAIEKTLGVPIMPVPGEVAVTNPCSLSDIINALAVQLQNIRDDVIFTSSGVMAVKDNTISPTATIPFPTGWTTTLDDEIPDDSLTDEEELPMIDSVQLSSVTGLPTEGHITIINDVSTVPIPLHFPDFKIISAAKCYGKVGKDFNFEVQSNDSSADITVTGLPNGLLFLDGTITGVPTTAGQKTAQVTAIVQQGNTATQSLTIVIADVGTPKITNSVKYATLNVSTIYTISSPAFKITYQGIPNLMTATGLPEGMTMAGPYIVGTPRKAEIKDTTVTTTDIFGDSGSFVVQFIIED